MQTRVPEDLESTLKREASRRRLTVSHLIRNILEDALDLVDNVVSDVDQIVGSSVDLAGNVARNAARLAGNAANELESSRRRSRAEPTDFADILAWNPVVLNRDARCGRCERAMARGEDGFLAVRERPDGPPVWLCVDCRGQLGASVGSG